ncbi:hypothetical protein MMC10_002611 [Thelotrema lepadinum]|nr:hypothetical protein [Thelotrema lepadinum]
MSSTVAADPVSNSSSTPKSKKSRKKKASAKNKIGVDADNAGTNGSKDEAKHDDEDEAELDDDTKNEAEAPDNTQQTPHKRKPSRAVNGTSKIAEDHPPDIQKLELEDSMPKSADTPEDPPQALSSSTMATSQEPTSTNGDTEERLNALAREREALRDEVAQLRQSLEELRGKHNEETTSLRQELEETQGEKENADTQYRNLLGRVNTIRSQLGERLKADAEELAQARTHIEELEESNSNLKAESEARSSEIRDLGQEADERSKELSTLRNRLNLSQQNWTKEREEFVRQEASTREDYESAKQAMQDWEILAMEERSIRENLGERVAELEDQVGSLREGNQSLESERSTQAMNVDGLQRALRELQETRKQELRELVENSQTLRQDFEKQLSEAQETSNKATKSLETTQKELDRLSPLESEVKEKNLLIGKLRHEAVILNDHLTKALKQLKRGKPEDVIDRALMTNHFLHFLALDRSDPKKFQVLQIMASLLNWSDEQREQAGLSRPGASNPSLRTPISPWHRTPSTPSLSTDFLSPQPTPQTGRDSLAGMFSDFLENEATSSGGRSGRGSRSTSVSSSRR